MTRLPRTIAMRADGGRAVWPPDVGSRLDTIEQHHRHGRGALAADRCGVPRSAWTAKMEEVLQSTTIDEARILTEAAIFADKIAVDEETVRLRSPRCPAAYHARLATSPMGRKMDFLIQEVNRESNTIGSKCNDITIARDVVAHEGGGRKDPRAGAEHRVRRGR